MENNVLSMDEHGQSAKKTLNVVRKVHENLKRHRNQFESYWREEERAFFATVWENETTKHVPFENHIWRIIKNEVPVLTDSMPKSFPEATDPALKGKTEVLKKASDWVDADQCYSLQYANLVERALITGTAWLYQY